MDSIPNGFPNIKQVLSQGLFVPPDQSASPLFRLTTSWPAHYETGLPGHLATLDESRRWPAKLVDQRGPYLYFQLEDSQKTPEASGLFWLPKNLSPANPPKTTAHLPGLAAFLKHPPGRFYFPSDGFNHKVPKFWRRPALADLTGHLSPDGLNLLWCADKDCRDLTLNAIAAEALKNGTVLVVGDNPSILEEATRSLMASGHSCIYAGAAAHDSALAEISRPALERVWRQTIQETVNQSQNEHQQALNVLSSHKTAQRQWQDFDDLEQSLFDLQNEVEAKRQTWRKNAAALAACAEQWQNISRQIDQQTQGWLGRLAGRGVAPDLKKAEEEARQRLEQAEEARRLSRLEEEALLDKALQNRSALEYMRAASTGWPPREKVAGDVHEANRQCQISQLALKAKLDELTNGYKHYDAKAVHLALWPDLTQGGNWAKNEFDAIIVFNPAPPEPNHPAPWMDLGGLAKRQLIVLGDFTEHYFWDYEPAKTGDNQPAWGAIAPMVSGGTKFWGQSFKAALDKTAVFNIIISRSADIALGRHEYFRPVAAMHLAECVINLIDQIDNNELIYVVTQGPNQGDLLKTVFSGAAKARGRIMAGLPSDFFNYKPAKYVVVDNYLDAATPGRQWGNPSSGWPDILKILKLAGQNLILAGDGFYLDKASPKAPLNHLWPNSRPWPVAMPMSGELLKETLWDTCLAGIENQAVIFGPELNHHWWDDLKQPLLSAAAQGARISLFCQLPRAEHRDQAGKIIKKLRQSGLDVYLAQGFGLCAGIIDQRLILLGSHNTPLTIAQPPTVCSAELPEAAKTLLRILGVDLFREHLGAQWRGGRSCPKCGWPLVASSNPKHGLFIQCLNTGCMKIINIRT